MQHPPSLIYLTGFMGSGKSAVAPELGRLLGWAHADLDAEIGKESGMSVAEIFARKGEAFFRKTEREVLRTLSGWRERVIALGGGTLLDTSNREIIRATGILVYLEADAEILIERLGSASGRPLLSTNDHSAEDVNLSLIIPRLLREREPGYRSAEFTVPAEAVDPSATALTIARAIGMR